MLEAGWVVGGGILIDDRVLLEFGTLVVHVRYSPSGLPSLRGM
jgi:hypothetical protein